MKTGNGSAVQVLPAVTDYYVHYRVSLMAALEAVEITDRDRKPIETEKAFARLDELSRSIKASGRTQFLCGNGASASFANHMALDWTKNAKVRTVSFSDSALLTALGNDLGGDEIFSGALRLYCEKRDALFTISSSGNSPNILKAIDTAVELGLGVVTFSGLRPDNKSRSRGDLNFFVPAKTYGIVECAHQVILHTWLDGFLGVSEWERDTHQNMNVRSLEP